MIRYITFLTIAVAFLSAAWASDPGEPLDCDDWQFLLSGHDCLQVVQPPCSSTALACTTSISSTAMESANERITSSQASA